MEGSLLLFGLFNFKPNHPNKYYCTIYGVTNKITLIRPSTLVRKNGGSINSAAAVRNQSSDSGAQEEATDHLHPQQQMSSHHAINVCDDEPYSNTLAVLQQKLNTPPRILSRSAGRPTCSIFKIPQSFVEATGKHYQPQIVSIGPFHRGKPHLEMIQEHKYHYLSLLLARSNLTLKALFQTLEPVENIAREAYSEEFDLHHHDFIELLVVDGCFITELFRKVAKLVPIERYDPIFSPWILYSLIKDLLLLENQIPFFVLQKLFDHTMGMTDKERSENASLVAIFFECLNFCCERPPEVIQTLRRFKAKHLLDLCRTSFIPPDLETKNKGNHPQKTGGLPPHGIHGISQLRRAGIKIRTPTKNGSSMFLAVKFRRREAVIEMPPITMDDFMCSIFANCVAYERSHWCPNYFITYSVLLDCLVNSYKDVEYLSNHNVIENYVGTDIDVADFIKNLAKDSPFDMEGCYLKQLFEAVNYHENSWKVNLAIFKYTYFKTPFGAAWSFISAIAALVLLVLSVLQTVYTLLGYFAQNNQ